MGHFIFELFLIGFVKYFENISLKILSLQLFTYHLNFCHEALISS